MYEEKDSISSSFGRSKRTRRTRRRKRMRTMTTTKTKNIKKRDKGSWAEVYNNYSKYENNNKYSENDDVEAEEEEKKAARWRGKSSVGIREGKKKSRGVTKPFPRRARRLDPLQQWVSSTWRGLEEHDYSAFSHIILIKPIHSDPVSLNEHRCGWVVYITRRLVSLLLTPLNKYKRKGSAVSFLV